MAAAPDCSIDTLVAFDEQFHEAVVRLSGNAEMLRTLQHINARIRFVRWIDMRGRRHSTQSEHPAILRAIGVREAAEGCGLMETHVRRRMERIVEAVREGYARIYAGDAA